MDACGGTDPRFDISHPDWVDSTDFGVINTTVGWLLAVDEDWVISAAEIDESGGPRGTTEVPTCNVLEILTLVKGTS
jgi:hypothetical protein